MKIETIIGAMITASLRVVLNDEPNKKVSTRHRQYHAFRDRIIQMDKDKDEEIEYLLEYGGR